MLVGGAALPLRGTVSRPTKDGDIVGERLPDGTIARLDHLPPDLARAALDVARAYGLADDWLNLGPASLLDGPLPLGFDLASTRVTMAPGDSLREAALGRLAAQWTALGGHLDGPAEIRVVDLEALLAATARLAPEEPRLGEVALPGASGTVRRSTAPAFGNQVEMQALSLRVAGPVPR